MLCAISSPDVAIVPPALAAYLAQNSTRPLSLKRSVASIVVGIFALPPRQAFTPLAISTRAASTSQFVLRRAWQGRYPPVRPWLLAPDRLSQTHGRSRATRPSRPVLISHTDAPASLAKPLSSTTVPLERRGNYARQRHRFHGVLRYAAGAGHGDASFETETMTFKHRFGEVDQRQACRLGESLCFRRRKACRWYAGAVMEAAHHAACPLRACPRRYPGRHGIRPSNGDTVQSSAPGRNASLRLRFSLFGSKSLPPLPPPIGNVVRAFLKACSKPRNLRMEKAY